MLCYHKKQHLVKREDRLKSGKVTNQKQKFGKQKAEIKRTKREKTNIQHPTFNFQRSISKIPSETTSGVSNFAFRKKSFKAEK